jgi:hypothetical protein
MRRRLIAGMVTAVLVVAGCSASGDDGHHEDTVSGVVTEVTGDLVTVESFVVLDDNGDSHLFTPEPGLLFYGGPLGHLRDHVVTGQRVTVTFEPSAYGGMTATLVVHEDADEPHDHG